MWVVYTLIVNHPPYRNCGQNVMPIKSTLLAMVYDFQISMDSASVSHVCVYNLLLWLITNNILFSPCCTRTAVKERVHVVAEALCVWTIATITATYLPCRVECRSVFGIRGARTLDRQTDSSALDAWRTLKLFPFVYVSRRKKKTLFYLFFSRAVCALFFVPFVLRSKNYNKSWIKETLEDGRHATHTHTHTRHRVVISI